MADWLERTRLLLGEKKLEELKNKHVLIVGLGGVGSAAAEMLTRAGVGKLTIADGDVVDNTNRNRQLIALLSNVGKAKADEMKARLLDINPELIITALQQFLRDDTLSDLLKKKFDYVVDAIDTLTPKIYLIKNALENQLPIISSMGAGGRLDPTQIKISDISNSYNDNLARMLRKRLHKMNIYKGVKVVFSSEKIDKSSVILQQSENKKSNVGTISYMPPIFGMFIASVVVRDLINHK